MIPKQHLRVSINGRGGPFGRWVDFGPWTGAYFFWKSTIFFLKLPSAAVWGETLDQNSFVKQYAVPEKKAFFSSAAYYLTEEFRPEVSPHTGAEGNFGKKVVICEKRTQHSTTIFKSGFGEQIRFVVTR